MDRRLKASLEAIFAIISLGGSLSASLDVRILGLDVRPVIYYYSLALVVLLSAIQLSRIIEALPEESPPFLLTTFFRLEDVPKKDVTKDPTAFAGLVALLLGGYVIRPTSFVFGILKALRLRPPGPYRLAVLKNLLLSYAVIATILLAAGLTFIEKRYA